MDRENDCATLLTGRKSPLSNAAHLFPRETIAFATSRPLVLDMGEASREQGFRQNGCR